MRLVNIVHSTTYTFETALQKGDFNLSVAIHTPVSRTIDLTSEGIQVTFKGIVSVTG